jgi:hypothetical protein
MRWVAQIPHPSMTINLYSHNERWIWKFEAGPMEQTFKIPYAKIANEADAHAFLTEEFLQEVHERFNDMFLSLKRNLEE